ncbi:MAG: VTT domain-containing protein [Pseudomonadota bacterium]
MTVQSPLHIAMAVAVLHRLGRQRPVRLGLLLLIPLSVTVPFWWSPVAHGVTVLVDDPGVAIAAAGALGPVAVVALIALATVIAPIPGGPIAVAAGALYGASTGGVLTLAGAVLGAITAFAIARALGRDAVRGSRLAAVAWIARPRPQGRLMAIVFLSRLVPFISFDAVSYAAGLSTLAAWRFALATFAGIAPMSFLLAAVGAGLVDDPEAFAPLMMLFVGLTAVQFLATIVIKSLRRAMEQT